MLIHPDDYNFDFLLKLRGSESLGIDKNDYLFILSKEDEKTAHVAQALLNNKEKLSHIQNIAKKALTLRIPDFQVDKDHKPGLFSSLIYRFSINQLITPTQVQDLAMAYYDTRYKDLLELYDGHEIYAEAHVTSEMTFDPILPEDFRDKTYPVLVEQGVSGTYFLKNRKGQIIGIFKPEKQEFGMELNPKNHKKSRLLHEGHTNGTSWLKEIAAYEIDYDGFMNVPQTTEMMLDFPKKLGVEDFEDQIGSFQVFIPNTVMMAEVTTSTINKIPDIEIQKVALFDLLILNGDRNLGNFLLKLDDLEPKKVKKAKVVPIDHGVAFLTKLHFGFEWLRFDQMKKPVVKELQDWLLNFDIDESCKKLEGLSIEKEAILNHRIMHAFLINGIKKGRTLFEIALDCKKVDGNISLLELKIEQTRKSLHAADANVEDMNTFIKKFLEVLGEK